jgi:8-oxo-dGTP pyrophosphatase MutT (NUDIX family)
MSRFPVSVKAVLLDPDQRVVLLKNEREEWELPGGKLEEGEQPSEAVIREIKEELGFRVRCGPILDSWLYEVLPGTDVLIVTYLVEVASFDGIQHSEEHTAVGRFTLAEIEKLAMPEGYRASIRRALHRMHHPASPTSERT